jgi:hypothetical protein
MDIFCWFIETLKIGNSNQKAINGHGELQAFPELVRRS